MTIEHLDVIIVGAGLSGIGAAHHLKAKLPGKTFAILEAREAIGGTWDLFRYPGIRSDSDMFTLGYEFRPWVGENAIADGASILDYIRATAAEDGTDARVRMGHKVKAASWCSTQARWTLTIERGGETATMSCSFLFLCAGYYDYDGGYQPAFPGVEQYAGRLVHPQHWPESLETKGRRVVVIGSGATAVTLVPALAEGGANVTMLQRSPSYVVSRPAKDKFARLLARLLPARLAYDVVRWRNILLSLYVFNYARRKPDAMRGRLLDMVRKDLGDTFDIETHFNPKYNPWDQRMCLVPDADLFKALKGGVAEIVTDEIETFTPDGLRLRSGRDLPADVVVSATGLRLKLVGGIGLAVDGVPQDLSRAMSYKGSMFSGVPNLAYALGYTNASWTLKCDLTSRWVCRVLAHMDDRDLPICVPTHDPSVAPRPLIEFSSGYVRRAIDAFPKQGERKPWRLNQNYLLDTVALRYGAVDDGVLRFERPRQPERQAA